MTPTSSAENSAAGARRAAGDAAQRFRRVGTAVRLPARQAAGRGAQARHDDVPGIVHEVDELLLRARADGGQRVDDGEEQLLARAGGRAAAIGAALLEEGGMALAHARAQMLVP